MRLNRHLLLIILFLLPFLAAFPQGIIQSKNYPQDFRNPLDISPSLAGSFGEIRSNHFHSGLDYRTKQREGFPVYAVADGYISRLRVQLGGFGNAVYISHPNGYTSVYAHLQRYNTRITQIVKDLQYRRESFEVDFTLAAIEIPVKKGEIIAWSGNTGGSAGPHLHFEIRDSNTEETINPQLFGFVVPDNVKPQLTGLYLYNLNGNYFSEKTRGKFIALSGSNGNYSANTNVIKTGSQIAFGISGFDQQVAGGNKNGLYSVELFLDGEKIYSSALEKFAFKDSKAINSFIDYPALIASKQIILKSFIEPGNPLTVYTDPAKTGIILLTNELTHEIQYIVKDIQGNSSTLNFRVQKDPLSNITIKPTAGVKAINYADSSTYSTDRMRVIIPKHTLYSTINLQYSLSAKPTSALSEIHNIHTRSIPVHNSYYLWIKPDINISQSLQSKVCVVDTRGSYHGGVWDKGFVKGNPKVFGSFYIRLDTIAPIIRPINIVDEKSMYGIKKIILKLSDNLSGIKTYKGTIDGQWVLFDYDLKTATLTHTFEDSLEPGKHIFQFVASDMKLNTRTYNATFYK